MPSFDESVTWVAVGACAAALLACVLVAVLLRRRWAARREWSEAEPALADLNRAVERAREEAAHASEESRHAREEAARTRAELRWLRHLSDIGATVELEGVLQRGLEAATQLANAAAAVIALTRAKGEPLVATFGLSAEESARELLGVPPDGGQARAVTLGYRYTEDEIEFDEFRLRGGLAIPMVEEGERMGTLAVFWRRVERGVSDEELERLEALARALVAALRNAFRFEDLRCRLESDPVTGLGTERALPAALDRETARAHRYERRLSLLLLGVSPRTTEFFARMGERLLPALRSSDVACHAGNGAFAVVLPESALADAERVFRRLESVLGSEFEDDEDPARLLAGIAELRPDDDAVSLLQRAESALARTGERDERHGWDRLNPISDRPTL
jgi:GGDEF domain-containing protein